MGWAAAAAVGVAPAALVAALWRLTAAGAACRQHGRGMDGVKGYNLFCHHGTIMWMHVQCRALVGFWWSTFMHVNPFNVSRFENLPL